MCCNLLFNIDNSVNIFSISALFQQRRIQASDRLEAVMTTVYLKPETTTCMFSLSQSEKCDSDEADARGQLHCYLHKRFDRVMRADGNEEKEEKVGFLRDLRGKKASHI